jgi:hypothetical protein
VSTAGTTPAATDSGPESAQQPTHTAANTHTKAQDEPPVPTVREAWRDFRRAVTGRADLTLTATRSQAIAAVQAEFAARGLPLLRLVDHDDHSILYSRIDGDDLDIRIIPEGSQTRFSLKIGNFGDSAKTRDFLAALRRRLGQ